MPRRRMRRNFKECRAMAPKSSKPSAATGGKTKPAGKSAAKSAANASDKRAIKPATAAPVLADVRAKIDEIDRTIQALIAERANFAHQVGKAKGKLAAAVDYYRPERERRCCAWWWTATKARSAMKCWCTCTAKSCPRAWPSRSR
ncbi:P-protein [Xanthomonas arboricola pv. pruni str. MAFF 311562]|uniref:chorismate mutase n=1 Tax=Xanthomonas arboricola pv. pruni str. MAFF 311562 TaxID=1414836 RepID=W4S5N1_9XANT|nr:P-protein [Xanthomonas arboricola pv. pruni str. MAFF 311562]